MSNNGDVHIAKNISPSFLVTPKLGLQLGKNKNFTLRSNPKVFIISENQPTLVLTIPKSF
jgi:hypothetical protein